MNKKDIHDYFSFTRQERRGIVVLCVLIVSCWCIPVAIEYFHQDKPQDFSVFENEVKLFQQQQDSLKFASPIRHEDQKDLVSRNVLNDNELPEPFYFNPNTLSDEGWQKLGVSLRVIHTIQNYRKAGGRFYKKEDVKKIYGFSSEMYHRLEPYMQITGVEPDKNNKAAYSFDSTNHYGNVKASYAKSNAKDNRFILDINLADSSQWTKLKGIGPALSSRIIRFRNALGGFHSIEQITEVYGLPDSTYQNIKQQLNISPFDLKKLNINTASQQELKSHPYIGYRLAASIKTFRDQHGSFNSVEDIKRLQLVDDQIYSKLAPYLIVN
ncbi:MAG: ComEA family DNA-binding protein [Chitinophagaceae bacterium]